MLLLQLFGQRPLIGAVQKQPPAHVEQDEVSNGLAVQTEYLLVSEVRQLSYTLINCRRVITSSGQHDP
jgi:hypothetical protein